MACCSGVCDWTEELVDEDGAEDVAVRGTVRGAGIEDDGTVRRYTI